MTEQQRVKDPLLFLELLPLSTVTCRPFTPKGSSDND